MFIILVPSQQRDLRFKGLSEAAAARWWEATARVARGIRCRARCSGERSRRKRYIPMERMVQCNDVRWLAVFLSNSTSKVLLCDTIRDRLSTLYTRMRHSSNYNTVMPPFHRGLISTSTPWTANAIARRSFTRSAIRHQNPPPDPTARSFFRIFRRMSVVLSTFLGLGLIFSYAPPFRTTTKEGRTFDQYLQSQ